MVPIFILFLFSVMVPSVDCYSDIHLAVKAIQNGHPLFGAALLVPVGLNTIFQFFQFWRFETDKKYRWPLVILQVWHQWQALKVIRAIWKDLDDGLKRRDRFNENIGTLEPYLEAAPQLFVKLQMSIDFLGLNDDSAKFVDVFGESYLMFIISISVSYFGGIYGLCKTFSSGHTRILPQNHHWLKWLAGYAICLVSVTSLILSKGIWMACINVPKLILIPILFIPNIIVSFVGLLFAFKCNGNLWMILFKHPMIALLPIFTPFAHSKSNLRRSTKCEPHVVISKHMTCVNIMVNLMQLTLILCWGIHAQTQHGRGYGRPRIKRSNQYQYERPYASRFLSGSRPSETVLNSTITPLISALESVRKLAFSSIPITCAILAAPFLAQFLVYALFECLPLDIKAITFSAPDDVLYACNTTKNVSKPNQFVRSKRNDGKLKETKIHVTHFRY